MKTATAFYEIMKIHKVPELINQKIYISTVAGKSEYMFIIF